MTAADKIRALMADGKTRSTYQVARAIGATIADTGKALRSMRTRSRRHGLILPLPSPPCRRRRGRPGPLWHINPNHRDALALNTTTSQPAPSTP